MSMPTSRFVRYTAGAAILTIALAGTAACSSSASSSPSASSSAGVVINGHNAQDMAFLTDMIAHHQQAIDMAQMVPSHTNNAKVTALAAQIEAAQGPEIAKMQTWLDEWNEASRLRQLDRSLQRAVTGCPEWTTALRHHPHPLRCPE